MNNSYIGRHHRQILVADDDNINRQLLKFMLQDRYDILLAEDGQQALDILHEKKDEISLVLTDILMPVMDGLEFLKVRRNDSLINGIPVIVMTSEDQAEVDSLKLGAVDFIKKPFDHPEIILARVQRSIELFEERKLITATEKDELTGLYNRRYFFQYAMQMDKLNHDKPTDAIVMDVNHFHLINSIHGKQFGDEVLVEIASLIAELCKDGKGIACRSQADQYLIYRDHSEQLEEEITELLSKMSRKCQNANVRVRTGIYRNSDHSVSLEERLDRASTACNTIRNNFFRNIAYYDDKMREQELLIERLNNGLQSALDNRELAVYFQPKYDVSGDKPVLYSAEALVRWIHPELGIISPGVFVPLFEENGLIQKVDLFVWREAGAMIRKWRDEYGINLPVSVNVSRSDLYDENIFDNLRSVIKDNNLDSSDLHLEITESAYRADTSQMIDAVKKLQAEGFIIEMDDFGTGYSALNMLTELPIDILKLDMLFLRKSDTNQKNRDLISMVINIANLIPAKVIAEGVETAEHVKMLKEMGCYILQGYYFSKPLCINDFEKLLKEEKC